MGEMAEYYDDFHAGEAEAADDDEFVRLSRGMWEQRDGSLIHVSKMTKRHLENTVWMITRNRARRYREEWIDVLRDELKRRDAGKGK